MQIKLPLVLCLYSEIGFLQLLDFVFPGMILLDTHCMRKTQGSRKEQLRKKQKASNTNTEKTKVPSNFTPAMIILDP